MAKWTPEKIEILKQNYGKTTKEELMELLPGISAVDIRDKAFRLGLSKKRKYWTPEEEEILKQNYGKIKISELMVMLPGRDKDSIFAKAMALGLTKSQSETWTKEEDELLEKNYISLTIQELVLLFPNRTPNSIKSRAFHLGLATKFDNKPWTKQEEAELIKHYVSDTAEELIKRFPNRSYDAIVKKATSLGLKKPSVKWTKEEDEIILKYYKKETLIQMGKRLPHRSLNAIKTRAGILFRKLNKNDLNEIETVVVDKIEEVSVNETKDLIVEEPKEEIKEEIPEEVVEEHTIEEKIETKEVIVGTPLDDPTEKVVDEAVEMDVLNNAPVSKAKKQVKKIDNNKSKNNERPVKARKKVIWTEEDDEIIKEYFLIESIEEIIKRLPNYTEKEIISRAKKLNVIGINSKPAHWKEKDTETLKEYYPIEGTYAHNRLRRYNYNSFMAAVKQLGLRMNRHTEPWAVEEDYLACEFYLQHIDDWSTKESIEELYNIFVSKGFVNHGRKTIHMKLANCSYIHTGEGLEHASEQNIKVYNKLTGGNLFTRFFRWLRRIFKI